MFNDLTIIVDGKFYNHIHSKSSIPIKQKKTKNEFCNELLEKLNQKKYSPSVPRNYLVQGKELMVSRIIPILEIKDYCVYYYCVKKLEAFIEKSRVEDTFGGFSMGGALRKNEDMEFAELANQDSISNYPFNPVAWAKEWGDFQNKIYTYSNLDTYTYYLKFDIANFYDCINLNYLESKIRASSDSNSTGIIDLMFYFLRNWNKDFESYKTKNIGLPQDEVGDCSRVLANFYLHEYDKYMKIEAEKLNCKIVRYSDDQVIFSKDEYSARKLLFLASNYLSKINLNINSKKIDIFKDTNSFNDYWSFDVYELLADPKVKTIEKAIEVYFYRKEQNTKFKATSIIKKIVNVLVKSNLTIDLGKLKMIEAEITKESVLSSSPSYFLDNINKLLEPRSRAGLVNKLHQISKVTFFNHFHYSLINSHIKGLNKKEILNQIYKFE
jgi:Reverse transcriptase (RNA-dependent DNA polymerase)